MNSVLNNLGLGYYEYMHAKMSKHLWKLAPYKWRKVQNTKDYRKTKRDRKLPEHLSIWGCESLKREENIDYRSQGSEIQEKKKRRGHQHSQEQCSLKLLVKSMRANSIAGCR